MEPKRFWLRFFSNPAKSTAATWPDGVQQWKFGEVESAEGLTNVNYAIVDAVSEEVARDTIGRCFEDGGAALDSCDEMAADWTPAARFPGATAYESGMPYQAGGEAPPLCGTDDDTDTPPLSAEEIAELDEDLELSDAAAAAAKEAADSIPGDDELPDAPEEGNADAGEPEPAAEAEPAPAAGLDANPPEDDSEAAPTPEAGEAPTAPAT